MTALVTGASGMLAADLCNETAPHGIELCRTDIVGAPVALDITRAPDVRALFDAVRPNVVIHCAAYTQVDKAESSVATCFRINALGTEVVAQASAAVGASLCYISTDFVFDGRLGRAYHEYDTPHPLSVYAASKLAGEVAVSRYCLRHWIVRTAWLYGVHGRSFAATMLTLAAEGKPLRVVADQTGSPTFTVDLARAVWALVAGCDYGVHHIVNGGETTWYDLACAVLSDAGYDPAQVEPIPSSAWPAAARRPAYSVLSSLRTESPALAHMRPWPEAVADFVARKQEAWSAR